MVSIQERFLIKSGLWWRAYGICNKWKFPLPTRLWESVCLLRRLDSHEQVGREKFFIYYKKSYEQGRFIFKKMLSEHACLLVHNKQAGWLSHLLLNRDVTTGATGATVVAPKFSDTLTL